MQQFVQASVMGSCWSGTADANGTLALLDDRQNNATGDKRFVLDFVTSNSTFLQEQTAAPGRGAIRIALQNVGLSAAVFYGWPQYTWYIAGWDGTGNYLGASSSFVANNISTHSAPAGGILFAGDVSYSSGASPPVYQHAAVFYDTPGNATPSIRWGPKPLASRGQVFGTGVDLLGRSLVVTDGRQSFGAGTISGQWFATDGTPLTGELLLLPGFVPGNSTWFETAPLIGGGVVVYRIDSTDTFHSHALAVVAGPSASPQAAPDWMTSRADTRMQIVRGGRGYAFLPFGSKGVACTQRVEVVAPDGTVCGARDYPMAAGTCDTGDLTAGADGTVIQPAPRSQETDDITGAHTCTWRWWTGALR